MNRFTLAISIALMLIITVFSLPAFPENTDSNVSTATQIESLSDDERLQFLATDETETQQEPGSAGLLAKTIGAMLLVVSLLFFGAWSLRKLGFGSGKSSNSADEISLAVLSTLSMGNGRTISTIRFGERVLLVGATPQAFTLLADEEQTRESIIQSPRSVAEMLADDARSFTRSFNDEFENAQSKLGIWNDHRGNG